MIEQDQLMWIDGHEVAAQDGGPWPPAGGSSTRLAGLFRVGGRDARGPRRSRDYTAAQSVLVNLSRTPFHWFGSSDELRYS